jgi:hypothetical protein
MLALGHLLAAIARGEPNNAGYSFGSASAALPAKKYCQK